MEKFKKFIKQFGITAMVAVMCSSLIVTTVGCSQQKTAASLIGTVGVAVATLETIEGNTANLSQIQAAFAAAQNAVANWKTGTPVADVVQALNILQQNINLLPVNAKDAALISLAIATVDQIIVLFPGATPAVTARFAVEKASFKTLPKNSKNFKQQWNAIIATNPSLSGAVL